MDSPRHVHTYQVHSVTDKLLIHYLEMPDLTQIDPLQKRRPKLNLTIEDEALSTNDNLKKM